MLDIRQVVRALNHRDEDLMQRLLAQYAREGGAFYISASSVWFEPATSGSTSSNTRQEPTGG